MDDAKRKKAGVINKKKGLFVVLVISLAVLGAAIYWFAIENERLSNDYEKQNDLSLQQEKFDDLYHFIQKSESGVRAYAIFGDKKYVNNISSLFDSIRGKYIELKESFHIESDSTQKQLYAELGSLLQEKIAFTEKAKKLCDENDCNGAVQLIATERGIDLTTAIMAVYEKANSSIRTSLLKSRSRFARANKRNNNIAYLGIGAAMLSILVIIYLLRREIQRTKRIGEELRKQKEYLRITLNSIGEGLIVTDKNGRIDFMNPFAENLTGWKNKEAKNQPLQKVYNVFTEENGLPFENITSRILKDGLVVATENGTILKTKSGDSLIISNNGSPLLDNKGQITGAVLIFKDITQQKISENEIKKSETEFRDLIENLSAAVYTCDIDGYIQLYNKAAVKIWGREPIIGKELWCGSWKIFEVDGTELPLENCPMAITLKEARPVLGREVMVQRTDGSFRHVLPSPAPLFNADGKLTGAVNMLIDITDKKEKEILIKTTEEKYKNLIEQATDAIVIYSIDGEIHEFNKVLCKITGYTTEELKHNNISDFIVGDMVVNEKKHALLMAGEPITFNRQFRHKENYIYDLEIKSQLLPDGKILAFARDVTERNKSEEELRRLKESYLTLINNVDGIVWEADAKTFEFSFVSKKAERLLGYPPEQWITQTTFWADHIYKEDRNWAVNYCIQCTKDKVSHDFEYRMVAADGRLVWLRDMVSVQVENNEPVKLIGIMVDISNQKLAEEESKNKNKQLQLLAEHLQEIREEERKSMAREIHDELGQQLTIMKMDASWLEENLKHKNEAIVNKIADFKSMIDQTVSTVRRIAYELRPSMLDDMGLSAAIEWLLAEFEKRSGVKTEYIHSKNNFLLTETAKTGLFRIVQESLTNVGRYAKAQNVKVSLLQIENNVVLSIIDDGIGFELQKLAFKKTLGIVGMKERCIMLGGEFDIDSTPGSGTKIKIVVPVQANLD